MRSDLLTQQPSNGARAAGPGRPSAPRHRLTLLGGFALAADGAALGLPVSAQRLIAFLALQQQPLSRVHVAGKLWLECSQERSSASLRSALWRARRPGADLVEASGHHLRLAADVAVDVREVTASAHQLIDESRPCSEAALDPDALTGELLPDWYDDWILLERERLRQLCLHALEALCRRLTAMGRYGAAVETGLAVVQREPLRESAHRALMTVHLAEGNRSEALRQYHSYRRLLRSELGLDPSPQLERLVVRAMRR